MPVTLTPIVNPFACPVTLADMKLYLRADDSSQDDVIRSMMVYAVEFIQRETQHQILSAARTKYLDAFPGTVSGISFATGTALQVVNSREIVLPYPPVTVINSVQYLVDGVWTDLDTDLYSVDVAPNPTVDRVRPGRVKLNANTAWPANVDDVANAVRVNYTAGYSEGNVPILFVQAIKWLVDHVYHNRQILLEGQRMEELPFGIRTTLESLTFREAHAA